MLLSRRTLLRAGTGALVTGLAGCAGGDAGDGNDSPAESPTPSPTAGGTTSPTPSATPTPTPTQSPTTTPGPASAAEAYPGYQWDRLDGVDPVPTSSIAMRGTAFHPLVAAFEPGTELTVTNEDAATHTFTVPRLTINERIEGGGTASITVDRTGTFDYLCTLHPPLMLGRLVVTENPPTPTPTRTPTPTTTGEESGY